MGTKVEKNGSEKQAEKSIKNKKDIFCIFGAKKCYGGAGGTSVGVVLVSEGRGKGERREKKCFVFFT